MNRRHHHDRVDVVRKLFSTAPSQAVILSTALRRNVRGILVLVGGVNAPLPPEAKKIVKI